MQTGLLHLHSTLRWLILIFLIIAVIKNFAGWQSRQLFTSTDKRIGLFTLIFTHINVLIGLFQLFFGRFGIVSAGTPQGVNVMKDSFYRFYWVEHPTMMVLAAVFVTIGYSVAKKSIPDQAKFKKAFWFYLIGLVLVLSAIPWPSREIVGRSLMP